MSYRNAIYAVPVSLYQTHVLLLTLSLDARLRKHIAQHLNTRSSTVRSALDAYNKEAAKLRRRVLTFEQVIEHDFLSEFDLLRDSRQDIRSRPWAETSNRLLRDSYFKRERAREEIERLNVEVLRLRSWMSSEEAHYERSLDLVSATDPALASEIGRRLTRMQGMHRKISRYLSKVEGLRGYSGPAFTMEVEVEVEDEWESDDENRHLDDVDQVLTNMERHG